VIMHSEPLRVCNVITGLGQGGAESFLERLVLATEGKGLSHLVVSLTDEGVHGPRLAAAGVPVVALHGRSPFGVIRLVQKLVKLFKVERPGVVNTWMYHANLVGGVAARLAGPLPVVWNIRANRVTRELAKDATVALARLSGVAARWLCRCVVTNSERGLATHVSWGYPRDLFTMIPNGFDLERLKPDCVLRGEARAALGIAPDQLAIGMLARRDPFKGHGTFIQAIASARMPPRTMFIMAGPGVSDGDPEMSSLCRDAGVAGVRLLGPQENVQRYFAALDVFTLPSLDEGFPNVVAEAMACGVPCVVTDVGDAARIVGDTGLVVPPRSPAAIADAWRYLAELSPQEREALGTRARERIRVAFSLDSVVRRYQDLLAWAAA